MLALQSGAATKSYEERRPNAVDLRFPNITLCLEGHVVKNYLLDAPPSCDELSATTTTQFTADVFAPPPSQYNVKAVSCSLITMKTYYTYWFFWSKTQTDGPVTTSPATSVSECKRWEKQMLVKDIGRLSQIAPGSTTFETNNVPQPSYYWTKEVTVVTRNARLTTTLISFDLTTGMAQHPFDSLLTCEPERGYCSSSTSMYTFAPLSLSCLETQKPLASNTTIFLHEFRDHHLFQTPKIDLAFTSLIQCPERVRRCYLQYKTVRCTTTHFVVASTDDDAIKLNLTPFSNSLKTTRTRDRSALILAQTISGLAVNLDYEIALLREEQLRLQCRNTRIMLTNLRATQLVNPSAVLSTILNRPAYATMGSSTLQEISCMSVSAILKPSLWVGNRLASRPIFLVNYANTTREAQWTTGEYLRWDLRDFMPQHPGFMIFRIQDRDFVFLNGTLKERHLPKIETLSLPNSDIQLPATASDPAFLAQFFHDTAPPFGLDYLHQALNALASINTAQLTSQGIDENELLTFQNTPVTHDQQTTVLSQIGGLFGRNEPIWTLVFRWLSYFWANLATLLALVTIATATCRLMRRVGQRAEGGRPHARAPCVQERTETATNPRMESDL